MTKESVRHLEAFERVSIPRQTFFGHSIPSISFANKGIHGSRPRISDTPVTSAMSALQPLPPSRLPPPAAGRWAPPQALALHRCRQACPDPHPKLSRACSAGPPVCWLRPQCGARHGGTGWNLGRFACSIGADELPTD